MQLRPLETKELPKSLPLKKLIGPSFILLGMGLGSGELILWPYLTSHFGMGIIWGALAGITLQFFMNMEIERYALVHGESIFVGFARKLKILPYWFILSTFIPWIWPGIAAASAKVFGTLFGIENSHFITIGLLLLIGVILSFGKYIYKTQESFQKYVTIIGVTLFLGLTFYLAKENHWVSLAQGIIGIGDGYRFLPVGIPIASFLAALAYAGAGGNLNLAQSAYIREKGYGMGKYTGKIKGLLHGQEENVRITGSTFEATPENIKIFKSWWKNINIEHLLVFWLTGVVTMVFLGLLSFITNYGKGGISEGIDFLFLEAQTVGSLIAPFVGTVFLVVAGVTLFGTQLGVMDATSRIISENLILGSKNLEERSIPKIYYIILWAQILSGIIIISLGLRQPLQLITISAVLNAFAMFIHTGLTLWINKTLLVRALRPRLFRTIAMLTAFLFYGSFSVYTIVTRFF